MTKNEKYFVEKNFHKFMAGELTPEQNSLYLELITKKTY